MLAGVRGPWWALAVALLPVLTLLAFVNGRGGSLGGQRRQRVRQAGGSVLLSSFIMEFGYWALDRPLAWCLRRQITPNQVTVAGLVCVLAGCAALPVGHTGIAGPLILLGSMSDMLDGALARAQQASSAAGELVDAVVDRIADLAVFCGLALYYGQMPWAQATVLAALGGSLCSSYTRARAQSLGVGQMPRGLLRRAERSVYLGFAILLAPVVAAAVEPDAAVPRYDLIWMTCVGIAVGTCAGTWQLLRFSMQQLLRGPAWRR